MDKNLYENIKNSIENIIFEELHISNEVDKIAFSIKKEILATYASGQKQYSEYNIPYKQNSFKYSIFGEEYSISYKIFFTTQNTYNDYKFLGNGQIYNSNKLLYLNLLFKDGLPIEENFIDIIEHEILHIYQYEKSKKKSLLNIKYKNLYDNVKQLYESIDMYNDDEKTLLYALYASFDFERDAFLHGLYGTLKYENPLTFNANALLKNSECFKYICDMRYSLQIYKDYKDFIENILKTNIGTFKKLVSNGLKKFEEKLPGVYQKALKDRH